MAEKNIVEIILSAKDATAKGIKSASGNLSGLGSTLKIAGEAFLALGAVAVGALAVAGEQSLENAASMGKMAKAAGVSVETFSTMAYAAQQSGVAVEDLQTGFKKLSVNMYDTSKGTGTAKAAFNTLGISVMGSNGTLKSSTAVMKEVADKFQGLQDGAQKTALAVAIFGKSGSNLIPMLDKGGKAISGLQDNAKALGLQISTQFAESAEQFNMALEKMEDAGKGVMNEVMAKLTPYLTEFAQWFASKGPAIVAWVAGFINEVQACSEELSFLVKVGETVGSILWTQFEKLASILATIGVVLVNLVQGQFREAISAVGEGMNDQVKLTMAGATKIKNIWQQTFDFHAKVMREDVAKVRQTAALQTQSFLQALVEQNANAISWTQQTGAQQVSTTESTLKQVEGLQSSHNIVLFRIGQAAAIANATINTIQGVSNALGQFPFPYNVVVAALVGALGAEQVAQIASASPPKMATGGIVPGTSTSGDNVPIMANSGELILNQAQQNNLAGQMNNGGDVNINMTLGDRTYARQFNRMNNGGRIGWVL